MPTLKELSAEYDALKKEKGNDDAALEELKPQLTTLNHIKYNFDVLERDYLPEEKDFRREEHQERSHGPCVRPAFTQETGSGAFLFLHFGRSHEG